MRQQRIRKATRRRPPQIEVAPIAGGSDVGDISAVAEMLERIDQILEVV